MENSVALLNFDGVYTKQNFYRHKQHEWIDLESIPSTNLLCELDTLKIISEMMSKLKGNAIHYLGSGNYHYVSYLLQSKIEQPYSLILFDHHTDTLPSPSENLISCGSWVLDSLQKLPMLKKVYMIGVSEDALKHIPESVLDRVVYYTKSSLHRNMKAIAKSIIKSIPTESVYISIDKDVLDKRDAVTGWDHGTLRLKELLNMLKFFIEKKQLIGLDICGEFPMRSANENLREAKEPIEKNDIANRILLNSISRWIQGNTIIPLKA